MFRISSEILGEITRAVLFVLAIVGLLAGLWPGIAGMAGVFLYPAESTQVHKDAGITMPGWTTQEAPSISWIHVHVEANFEVEVWIIAASNRSIEVRNVSGFPSIEDRTVVAGGGSNNQGIGRVVELTGSHGGPTAYVILVTASAASEAAGITDRNISYTLKWEIQKLDPLVFAMGLILFMMFFVTEYVLQVRSDLRAISRKLEKLTTEGVAAGRVPSTALGAPAPPYGFGAPPPAVAAGTAGAAGPSRRDDRRRLFGRTGTGQEVPPATEQESEAPPPMPSQLGPSPYAPPPQPAASPYAPPPPTYGQQRYAPPPPPAEEVMEPEYAPPPPPPVPTRGAPATARMAPPPPMAPPPAAAPPEQEPVTRVRCPQCKHIVPVYTAERPTPIKCPNCGKKGMLTR